MKERFLLRKPVVLSESTQRQLGMYTLAASAAGVGMLALAQPAEARIVYKPLHHVVPPQASFYILFQPGAGVGVSNFFKSSIVSGSQVAHALIEARGLGTYAGVVANTQNYALALPAGRRVRSTQFTGSLPTLVASTCKGGKVEQHGLWSNQKDRYLGVSVWFNRASHYGWVRLNVSNRNCKMKATVTGYAYETTANKPIITGKTRGQEVITSPVDTTAGTLGHLALGRK